MQHGGGHQECTRCRPANLKGFLNLNKNGLPGVSRSRETSWRAVGIRTGLHTPSDFLGAVLPS